MMLRKFLLGSLGIVVCLGCESGKPWEGAAPSRVVTPPKIVSSKPTSQAAPDSAQTELSPDLKKLEHDFIASIKQGNAQEFLKFVPEEGVSLGVDNFDKSSRRAIAREFHLKKGVYWLLFDSHCLTAEYNRFMQKPDSGNLHRNECSFKEQILTAPEASVSTSQRIDEGHHYAEILVDARYSGCPNENMLDFFFEKKAGMWKLVAIPYT